MTHTDIHPIEGHSLLPEKAKNILQQAAATPVHPRDPLARQRAINQAMAKVREMYPQFFKRS